MATVYTERFLLTTVVGTDQFVVPAGKRAIITSIVGLNGGPAGSNAIVRVAGTAIWIHAYQDTNQSVVANLRVAAYEGEVIAGVLSALYMSLTITGYLFDDSTLM